MIKRGWIEAGRDKPSRLKALLSFLGAAVVEPRAYQQAVGFRITEAAQRNFSLGALAVWLRMGELDAQEVSTADYDEEVFSEALAKIRRMTEQPPEEFIPAMSALCAEAESRSAWCRSSRRAELMALRAGWPMIARPLIQMSLRHKWADIFWFTFFHEACHLLKHRTQRRIVIEGLAVDPDLAEIEAEADEFAEISSSRQRRGGISAVLALSRRTRCESLHSRPG